MDWIVGLLTRFILPHRLVLGKRPLKNSKLSLGPQTVPNKIMTDPTQKFVPKSTKKNIDSK